MTGRVLADDLDALTAREWVDVRASVGASVAPDAASVAVVAGSLEAPAFEAP